MAQKKFDESFQQDSNSSDTNRKPDNTSDDSSQNTNNDKNKELEARVLKIVAEKLSIDLESVTVASRFQEDLGADSLDVVELLMEIEEEFGVNISDEEAEKLVTVGDAIRFISAKL